MNLRISSCLLALFLAAACAAPPPSTGSSPSTSKSQKDENGDDDADDGDDDDTSVGDTQSEKPPTDPTDEFDMKDFLMPDIINTGFTGGAEVFKVPLFTDLTGTLTWEIADPTLAEITPVAPPADYTEYKKEEPDAPDLQFAMLTTKKAGTSTVFVSGGGKKAEAQLVIKAYTSAAYAVGQARYKNAGADARQPCAGCHEKPDGADHSPSWLALFDDDDVLSAIQTGVYAVDKYEVNGGNHKWNLTEEEKTGIMAYLRGLAPRGF